MRLMTVWLLCYLAAGVYLERQDYFGFFGFVIAGTELITCQLKLAKSAQGPHAQG